MNSESPQNIELANIHDDSRARSQFMDNVLAIHTGGKLRTHPAHHVRNDLDLAAVYTPGVALPTLLIADDPALAERYTWRSNTVAVVTDGTAVLGLGDVGPAASLPVMEGKAVLMREFAGLNAVPICLDTTDIDEIVDTVTRIAPSFGAINLEDIAAPRCFEIEARLNAALSIPVFHDDQHGTAIVATAALLTALKLTDREMPTTRIVIQGAGAAGVAIATMIHNAGADQPHSIRVVDRSGVLVPGRERQPGAKEELARLTNPGAEPGELCDVIKDADVFIGVSGGKVAEELVATMASRATIMALANPDPEVPVEVATRYAEIVATGRSDYPNQINNVLVFPGIFRGALDVGATTITTGMQLAAVQALHGLAMENPSPEHIVPSVFNEEVAPRIAAAVARAALAEGVVRDIVNAKRVVEGTG